MTLYRPEVQANQAAQFLGKMRLHRPLSFSVGTSVAVTMACGLTVYPPHPGKSWERTYESDAARLLKGAGIGRLFLGSTVVMLFPAGRSTLTPDECRPGRFA